MKTRENLIPLMTAHLEENPGDRRAALIALARKGLAACSKLANTHLAHAWRFPTTEDADENGSIRAALDAHDGRLKGVEFRVRDIRRATATLQALAAAEGVTAPEFEELQTLTAGLTVQAEALQHAWKTIRPRVRREVEFERITFSKSVESILGAFPSLPTDTALEDASN